MRALLTVGDELSVGEAREDAGIVLAGVAEDETAADGEFVQRRDSLNLRETAIQNCPIVNPKLISTMNFTNSRRSTY
jgi:hypothetical protein